MSRRAPARGVGVDARRPSGARGRRPSRSRRGEFCCLCGPNGGGKTTLLKAALGLVPIAAGTIEVLGRPPGEGRAAGRLPAAGQGLQPRLPGARGRDDPRQPPRELAAARARRPSASAPARALARVGGERLLDAPLRGLSGGEMQRVFLARAIVNEPELLLLDEPTAGVDARGRAEFLDLLAGIAARDDLAAVLVTHNEAAVRRLADRVVYLDRRVLAWGPPDGRARPRVGARRVPRPRPRGARAPACARATSDGRDRSTRSSRRSARASCAARCSPATALGAAGALLGVFIVQRGLGLLSDGLAHATFGGLALGLLLGTTADGAIWVALPFTVAIALGIQYVRRRTRLGGDVATGVFFAVSFAAGILFLGLRSGRHAPVNVEGLLFGSLLAVSPEALQVILGVSAAVFVLLLAFGPRLAYATFDPELATLSGVPVGALEYGAPRADRARGRGRA